MANYAHKLRFSVQIVARTQNVVQVLLTFVLIRAEISEIGGFPDENALESADRNPAKR